MASIFRRGEQWVIAFKDAHGKWHHHRTGVTTKKEAERLALRMDHRTMRQEEGLEALPSELALSFNELLDWWWTDYGSKLRDRVAGGFVEKHLRTGLGALRVGEVTAPAIETFLHQREDTLSPRSLNYARSLIHRIFSMASRRGVWTGNNPAAKVQRRKEAKRVPAFLRADEVSVLLDALDPKWRPLFACALYTGMRKGELCGLKRSDVDLRSGVIMVARSYDHDTTKGRHADPLPIAKPLIQFLEHALAASRSEYVFPTSDGSMMTRMVALEKVLRRAMARVGMVDGWQHKCRRCRFTERRETDAVEAARTATCS